MPPVLYYRKQEVELERDFNTHKAIPKKKDDD